MPGWHRKRSKTRERCTPPSSRQEARQQLLTVTEKTKHQTAGKEGLTQQEAAAGGHVHFQADRWLEK